MKLSQALERAKKTEQNVSGVVTDPRQYPMALHEAVVALQDLIGAVERAKIGEVDGFRYRVENAPLVWTSRPISEKGILYFDAEQTKPTQVE